jgi:hypothetical protein
MFYSLRGKNKIYKNDDMFVPRQHDQFEPEMKDDVVELYLLPVRFGFAPQLAFGNQKIRNNFETNTRVFNIDILSRCGTNVSHVTWMS